MNYQWKTSAVLLAGMIALPIFAAPEKPAVEPLQITASVNRPNAIFTAGEEISLTVGVRENGKMTKGKFIIFEAFKDGNRIKREVISADKDYTFTEKAGQPGWISIRGTVCGADQKPIPWVKAKSQWDKVVNGGIGAMIDPEKIQPAAPEPADFSDFWKAQRAALDKVPLKAERTAVEVPKNLAGKVNLYDVKVDCAGAMPVRGYLAMPVNAKPKSLPAVVFYHGAGVRSSGKPLWTGTKAISFDVNAHGIENGKDANFYNDLSNGKLKGYPQFGKQSRDTMYFKDMYLRVMRALDYVKSLPEWDGKILIVKGGSQGGGQSIVAAALDPQVSLCVANVPALGDHAGWTIGRKSGWPTFYTMKNGKPTDEKAAAAAHYFDNNNFARHIKCPTYLSTGFTDFVCAPTSVYSVYNTLKTEKHMDTSPTHGHNAPIPTGEQVFRKMIFGK